VSAHVDSHGIDVYLDPIRFPSTAAFMRQPGELNGDSIFRTIHGNGSPSVFTGNGSKPTSLRGVVTSAKARITDPYI